MAKPIVRMIMVSLVAIGVGLVISSSIWVAGAQPRSEAPDQLFGTTTVVHRTTVTTTSPVVTATTSGSTTATSRSATTVGRPKASTTTTVPPPTTPAPTTTVAAIPGAAPPPVTLPLAVTQQSGHVSVFFPILSGLGFAALIAMLGAQYYMTGPGNRGGPTL